MVQDLGNQEDVSEALTASERKSSGEDFIKLDEKITFAAIITPKFAAAFEHWVLLSPKRGSARKVTCLGGTKGRGYAPDACPVCARAMKHYAKKKELLEEGDKRGAEEQNKLGNGIRARQRVYYIGVAFPKLVERVNGKVVSKPDLESLESKDSEITPKILALTDAQNKKLLSLIGEHPYIKTGTDLIGRVLKFKKKDVEGSDYPQIDSITPGEEVSIEVDEDELPDLEAQAKVSTEEEANAILEQYYVDASEETTEESDEKEESPKTSRKVDTDLSEDDFDDDAPPVKKGKKAPKEEEESDDEETEEESDDEEEEAPAKKVKAPQGKKKGK